MTQRTCLHCGAQFTAKRRDSKWCSKACGARYRRANPSATCSADGCDKGSIAKHLCSTHYNRTFGEAVRHPRQTVECVVCGTTVRRRKDSEGRYQPTCSVECRAIVQHGSTASPREGFQWRSDVRVRARRHGCRIIEEFDREVIFDRDGWLCQECGIQCNTPDPYDRTAATIDHVIPLSSGGEHSRRNVQTLCLSCNSRKSDRTEAAA